MKFYNIPFHEGFYINKIGEIKFTNRNNVCLSYPTFYNIFGVFVIIDNKQYLVSQLILTTFVGNINANICYIDGNIHNTSLSNLKFDINISHISDSSYLINEDEFRRIPDYPNYYISKKGVIYSEKSNMLLKNSYDKGYRTIDLYNDSKVKRKKIHRLVYITWMNYIDSSRLINHKDERKYNPSIENLEECDNIYNTRYSIKSESKYSPFTETNVRRICEMYSLGNLISEIENAVGIDKVKIRSLIYRIKCGQCYSDIARNYNIISVPIQNKRKLSTEDVEKICMRLSNGESGAAIAKSLNLGNGTVYNIKNRRNWKDVSMNYNFM